MDFWRAVDILWKRKWLIALSTLVVTIAALGATRLTGSKWKATVRFVEANRSPLTSATGEPSQVSEGTGTTPMAQAYGGIIKSHDVLEPAVRASNLSQIPANLQQAIEFVQTGPHIFELQYTDSSEARAASLANAMSQAFTDKVQDLFTAKAHQELTLLQGELLTAKAKLTAAQSVLENKKSELGIVGDLAFAENTALMHAAQAKARRDDASDKLNSDQAQLQSLQGELAVTPKYSKQRTIPVLDPNIPRYKRQVDTLQAKVDAMSKTYADSNPLLVKARADLQDANDTYKGAVAATQPGNLTVLNPQYPIIKNDVDTLRQRISADQATLDTLSSQAVFAETQVDKYKHAGTQLTAAESDVQDTTDSYTSLRKRVNGAQMQLSAARSQPNMVIMDPVSDFNPVVDTNKGRTLKLVLLAVILTIMVSGALIIMLDSVDRRLTDVRGAAIVLPARVIAAIPQPMGAVTYATLARATELNPQSLHSEAYRFLAQFLLSPNAPKARSIMVLSAKAEQGSTTTVTNLGITLAQAGKKVVIVDANVRTAELHHVFDIPNEVGFTDLLGHPDAETMEQALRPTSTPNLRVITTGHAPDNPWQLFRSSHLPEISRALLAVADYVLYDTPSALLFTDALNLAPVVDAAFLCVRALEPLTGAEERLVELLEQSGVRVLGSVLSDIPASVLEGYDNYQHYYGPALSTVAGGHQHGGTPLIDLPRPTTNGKNGSVHQDDRNPVGVEHDADTSSGSGFIPHN